MSNEWLETPPSLLWTNDPRYTNPRKKEEEEWFDPSIPPSLRDADKVLRLETQKKLSRNADALRLINTGPGDPVENTEKYLSALHIAEATGMDPMTVFRNHDAYSEAYWGRATPAKSSWKAIQDAWNTTQIGMETNMMRFQQMIGDESPELEERIKLAKSKTPAPDLMLRSIPVQFLKSAANLGASMWENIEYTAPRVAAGAVAAAGAAAGLAALSGPVAPAAVLAVGAAWFARGMVYGSGAYTFQSEAGALYDSLIEQGVDKDIAKRPALAVGVVNAAVETVAMRLVPGVRTAYNAVMKLVARDVTKAVVVEGILAATTKKLIAAAKTPIQKGLVAAGMSYVGGLITEPIEEGIQETSTIAGETIAVVAQNKRKAQEVARLSSQMADTVGEEIARAWARNVVGADIPVLEAKEIGERLVQTYKETMKGMVVVGPFGALLGEGLQAYKDAAGLEGIKRAEEFLKAKTKTVEPSAELQKDSPEEIALKKAIAPPAPVFAPAGVAPEEELKTANARVEELTKEYNTLDPMDAKEGARSLEVKQEVDDLVERIAELAAEMTDAGITDQPVEKFVEAKTKEAEPAEDLYDEDISPTRIAGINETIPENDIGWIETDKDGNTVVMTSEGVVGSIDESTTEGEDLGPVTTLLVEGEEGKIPWRSERLDPNEVVLSKEVPQQKGRGRYGQTESVVDEKTGVVEGYKITGFDEDTAPEIIAWERLDGTMEVVTGRHRLESAQREGASYIRSQVFREADGWTAEMGKTLDRVFNIRDGKGTIHDFVDAFIEGGLTREQAAASGLLSYPVGRDAWAIAKDASSDLRARWATGKVSSNQAASIARGAPGNAEAQAYVLSRVGEFKDTKQGRVDLELYAEFVASNKEGGSADTQLGFGEDIIGNADTRAANDAMEAVVRKRKAELSKTIGVTKGIGSLTEGRKAQDAKEFNVRANTEEARNARAVSEAELEAWSGKWWENPFVLRKARELAKIPGLRDLSEEERAQHDAFWDEINNRKPPPPPEMTKDLFSGEDGGTDVGDYWNKDTGKAKVAIEATAKAAQIVKDFESELGAGVVFQDGSFTVTQFFSEQRKDLYIPGSMTSFLNSVNKAARELRVQVVVDMGDAQWAALSDDFKKNLASFGYFPFPQTDSSFRRRPGRRMYRKLDLDTSNKTDASDSASDYAVLVAVSLMRPLKPAIASKQDYFAGGILQEWGETDDPARASYIMPDGKMSGFTAALHAERVERAPHSVGMDSASVEMHMLDTGAMRFDYANGVAHFVTKPTEAQIAKVAEVFRGKGKVLVEIGTEKGVQIAFSEVTNPTAGKLAFLLSGGDPKFSIRESDEAFGGDAKAASEARKVGQNIASVGARVEAQADKLWWEEEGVSPIKGIWDRVRRIVPRGLFLQNVKTIAEAWSVYRSSTVEITSVIFADKYGNEIDSHCLSYGLQGSAPMFSQRTLAAGLEHVRSQAKRLGAAKVYLVHNHPSGQIRASVDDLRLTSAFAETVPEFAGHVILDGNKFTSIDRNLDEKTHDYTPVTTADDPLGELRMRPRIESPTDAAMLGAKLLKGESSMVLIVTDWQHRILSWHQVSRKTWFKAQTIHQTVRKMGGSFAFVLTNDDKVFGDVSARLSEEQQRTEGKEFDVLDVILVNPGAESPVASASAMGDIVERMHHTEYVSRNRRSGEQLFDPLDPLAGGELRAQHRAAVFAAILGGRWVPDNVLEGYAETEWGKRELEFRQKTRDDARAYINAGLFTDQDEYADVMAASDPEGRTRAYWKNVWEAAADKGFEVSSAGRRWIESFTPAAAEIALHTLGSDTLFAALDSATAEVLRAEIDNLDPIIFGAIAEVKMEGSLTTETYNKVLGLVKADPGRYQVTLSGLAGKLSSDYAIRQAMVESSVDPDIATFDELRTAYNRVSPKVASLKGTVGELMRYAKEMEQNAGASEIARALDNAAHSAKEYVKALVKEIMKPTSVMVAQAQADAIRAEQQKFIIRGGRSMKAVQEKIKALIEADKNKAVSEHAARMMEIKSLDDMSMTELEQIYSVVKKLREEGRDIRINELVAKHRRQAEMINGAAKTIAALEGGHGKHIGGSVEDTAATRGGTMERLAWYVARPGRWAALLDGGTEGINTRMLIERVNLAEDEFARNDDRRAKGFSAKMQELGLKQGDFNKIIRVEGDRLTIADALGVYLYIKNEDSAQAIIHGNFRHASDKEAAVSAIIGKLSDKHKALGDWMMESFQGADKARLMTFVREQLNMAFTDVAAYFPMLREDLQIVTPDKQVARDLLTRAGVRPFYPQKGNIKSRIKIAPEHQSKIRLSAIAVYFDAIAKQEHLMAYQSVIEDLHAVYDSQRIRALVTEKFGGQANEIIKRYIQRIANPDSIHYADSPVDRQYRAIRSNVQMSALTWNIMVYARNLPVVGVWLYMRDAGPFYLTRGLTKLITNRKETIAFVLDKDPQVKQRYSDPLFWQLKQQSRLGYKNTLQKVGWAGLRALEHFDRMTVIAGWIACYDMMRDQKLPDGSPKFSEEQAVKYAQKATRETQPTGHSKDLSEFLDSNTGRTLALFGNQLSNMLNMVAFDLPADLKRKRFDRALGMAVGFVMTGVLMGMIRRKRVPDEPIEWLLDMSGQFLSTNPITDELQSYLEGRGYSGTYGGAYWSGGVRQAVRFSKTMFDSDADIREKADEAFKMMMQALRLTGFPSVAAGRVTGALATGDPWELVGGPPEEWSEEY